MQIWYCSKWKKSATLWAYILKLLIAQPFTFSEKQEFICHWQLIVWKTVALFIKNIKKNTIKSTNSVQWSVGPVLFGPPKLMFDSHGLLNKLQANYNLMFLHLKRSAQKEKIMPSRLDEGHEGKTLWCLLTRLPFHFCIFN